MKSVLSFRFDSNTNEHRSYGYEIWYEGRSYLYTYLEILILNRPYYFQVNNSKHDDNTDL
jgi:hypothetical protein